jgi:O-antigen/teichoic acid export membrane protein
MSLTKRFLGVGSIYLIGIPLSFLLWVSLARILSVNDFGSYSYVIALANVLAIPLAAGLPLFLTREMSKHLREADWVSYHILERLAIQWVTVIGATLLVIAVSSTLLIGANDNSFMIFAALIAWLLGFNAIRSGVMRALEKPLLAEIPLQIAVPSIALTGFYILYLMELGTVGAMLTVYLMSQLAAVGASVYFFRRFRKPAPTGSVITANHKIEWLKAQSSRSLHR